MWWRLNRIQRVENLDMANNNTGVLEQKKTSWTPVNRETDMKNSGPDHHMNISFFLSRGHHRVWTPTHRRAIKEVIKLVGQP